MSGAVVRGAEPKDWQFTVGEPAAEARARWEKLTQGEELARGKAVEFSPKPAYELTADDNDAYDLTDGKLSERIDDRVWFSKDAVGWHFGSGSESAGGVLLKVDLGEQQPVGQISIRLLGGMEQRILSLPTAIEFLASADGKNFYSLQNMIKLMPAERELSNFKTNFFVAEEGAAFMHAFVCQETVRARYIAIRIMPQADVFTDQISILKAEPGKVAKELTEYPAARVFTDGFVVMPKLDSFVVTTNIVTPNWLLAHSYGKDNDAKNSYSFRLKLPQGLRLLPQSLPKFTELMTADKTHQYLFENIAVSSGAAEGKYPLYIDKMPGEKISPGAKASFTGIVNGADSHVMEYPVQLIDIPKVPDSMGKTFDLCMGWIADSEQQNWPNYLANLRSLGFSMVPTFTMWWGVRDGQVPPASQHNLAYVEEARRQGFGIVQEDSPFHEMVKAIAAHKAAGTFDEKEASLVYNQPDGKPGIYFSPLYRGKYFQEEVARVTAIASIVQPDQIHWDVEYWWEAAKEAQQDPRAIEAWKKSGKKWDDFASDLGTEMLDILGKAVRSAVPTKKIKIGLYHSDPKNVVMDGIFDWNKLYPKVVDLAQPSLYVQGRATDVAERIRQNYKATGKRNIVPWLTAGTYGEFEPRHMEPMVLESILNGASGITYYYFPDFDPMDFYYHAKALATLGRFPDLMKSGKPIAATGNNPKLHYSGFANAKEALVLVGNYQRSHSTKVTVTIPLKNAKKAAVVNGKPLVIKENKVSLDVPAGEFRLVHVSAL